MDQKLEKTKAGSNKPNVMSCHAQKPVPQGGSFPMEWFGELIHRWNPLAVNSFKLIRIIIELKTKSIERFYIVPNYFSMSLKVVRQDHEFLRHMIIVIRALVEKMVMLEHVPESHAQKVIENEI